MGALCARPCAEGLVYVDINELKPPTPPMLKLLSFPFYTGGKRAPERLRNLLKTSGRLGIPSLPAEVMRASPVETWSPSLTAASPRAWHAQVLVADAAHGFPCLSAPVSLGPGGSTLAPRIPQQVGGPAPTVATCSKHILSRRLPLAFLIPPFNYQQTSPE